MLSGLLSRGGGANSVCCADTDDAGYERADDDQVSRRTRWRHRRRYEETRAHILEAVADHAHNDRSEARNSSTLRSTHRQAS